MLLDHLTRNTTLEWYTIFETVFSSSSSSPFRVGVKYTIGEGFEEVRIGSKSVKIWSKHASQQEEEGVI